MLSREELGPLLKKAREQTHPRLSQTALAEKVGYSKATVVRWENGEEVNLSPWAIAVLVAEATGADRCQTDQGGRMKRAVLVAITAAALAIAGCGGADDEEQIREVMHDYLTALGDGNGEVGCATLSEAAQRTYMAAASGGCEPGFAKFSDYTSEIDYDSLDIDRVDITGDDAIVGFDGDTATVTLQRDGDGWLINEPIGGAFGQ